MNATFLNKFILILKKEYKDILLILMNLSFLI